MHYCKTIGFLLLILFSNNNYGQKSAFIISAGVNKIYFKPLQDSAINNFRLFVPGIYMKFTGENHTAKYFQHLDINLSFNKGWIDNGSVRTSRLTFNYGFGKSYRYLKLSCSPGLCYSQLIYQNDILDKVLAETRFAPSLGLQADFSIINTDVAYLGLFIEGSAMFALKSRWMHQMAVGISFQPTFGKW